MANDYESFEVDYNNPYASQARSRGQSHGSIQRFLYGNRNPDGSADYHRLGSAFAEDFGGKPQNQTPAQQWNSAPSAPQIGGSHDDLYSLLMERAKQGTAVDRNDPTVRAQVDPMVAQQERSSRSYLDDLAEKSGPLANLQGERRLAAERTGQAAGQLESEVIGREVGARREEIQQALSMWGAMLSNDQRMALERELAILNDNARTADRGLAREGMLQSNDQFMRELALREFDLNNTWDYRWQGF